MERGGSQIDIYIKGNPLLKCMKEIKFRIRDEELPDLLKKKDEMSWRELFFSGLGIKRKEEKKKDGRKKDR